MIYFLLGLTTGLLNAGLLLIFAQHFAPAIHRTMNQIRAKTAPKGKILEEPEGELGQWLDSLKATKDHEEEA